MASPNINVDLESDSLSSIPLIFAPNASVRSQLVVPIVTASFQNHSYPREDPFTEE
mgnify:CR=1 FL=1